MKTKINALPWVINPPPRPMIIEIINNMTKKPSAKVKLKIGLYETMLEIDKNPNISCAEIADKLSLNLVTARHRVGRLSTLMLINKMSQEASGRKAIRIWAVEGWRGIVEQDY